MHEGVTGLRAVLRGGNYPQIPRTFPSGFALTLRPTALDIPLHWRRPRMVFVNSMSDLFHTDVPDTYLREVFDVMRMTPHHTFQILTKRAQRLARTAPWLQWPSNVWIGVGVESGRFAWRMDYLRDIPAVVRFISKLHPLGVTCEACMPYA